MSQRQQLERILEIDRWIREKRYPTADQLAKALEVGRRVIFKDRRFMVDRLGAPIVYDKAHGGWAYSDPAYALPTILVTEGELLAFFLSVEVARRYLGTSFEGPLRSAVEKIRGSLRGPVIASLEDLQKTFTLTPPPAAPAEEATLLRLYDAVLRKRRVEMTYYTAMRRKSTRRVVEPYHLMNQGGDWYLIAYDALRKQFRFFNLGRIRKLTLLENEPFGPRRDFDALSWIRRAFNVQVGQKPERVSLRFDAAQAPYIRERVWHPSQQREDLSHGAVRLVFETSGLMGVLRWVLQYGRHVEVEAPPSLRRAWVKEIRAMARKAGAA